MRVIFGSPAEILSRRLNYIPEGVYGHYSGGLRILINPIPRGWTREEWKRYHMMSQTFPLNSR